MPSFLGSDREKLPLFNQPNMASRQFNMVVRNYVNAHEALHRINPKAVQEGSHWYDRANEHATRIGKLAGGDTAMGAGIIASLSPQNSWNKNLADAETLARKGTVGGLPHQVAKAKRILAGEASSDVLKGLKETPFNHNILNPNDPNYVTVDRHHHDAGIGREFGKADRGLGAQGRVNIFHKATNAAALHLGIEVPSRFQASIWSPWEQNIRPQISNNFLVDAPTPDAADSPVEVNSSDTQT